ncbi:hypothetical protein AM609_14770 [Actinomyces sp. oral taxon 414]|nr:hypothetical protein AM609_14770 [Actinomyces sp. oral taxon 414]
MQSSQVRACPGFRFSLTPQVVRALSAARVPGRTRAAERDRPDAGLSGVGSGHTSSRAET